MNIFQTAHSVPVTDAAQKLGLRTRKSGDRLIARCPFHEDRTPSLVLYPGDRGFYCFSCQRHGDAITLYQHVRQLRPLDAARAVCEDFGLSWDASAPRPSPAPAPALSAKEAYTRDLCKRYEAAQRIVDNMTEQCRAEGRNPTELMQNETFYHALHESVLLHDAMRELDDDLVDKYCHRYFPKGGTK